MSEYKKNPEEASNIFHSIIKESVKPKASDLNNYDLVLEFIKMHPNLNTPIHMGIGKRITKAEVEEIVSNLFDKGYVTLVNSKPIITKKGEVYISNKKFEI